MIGGGLALGIYTFTPLGDHQTQDTSNPAPAQETSSVTAKQTSSESGSGKSANSSSANSSSISNMVEDISPAIVGITNLQKQQSSSDLFGFGSSSDSNSNSSGDDAETGSGSGVIFKKANGKAYIITNNHVVEGASSLKVSLYDGTDVTAKLVGSDSLTDLAVLEISDKHVTKRQASAAHPLSERVNPSSPSVIRSEKTFPAPSHRAS